MGLLVGLVFLQVDNTQGGNTARQGAIFFMAMQMTFGPVMAQFSTCTHPSVYMYIHSCSREQCWERSPLLRPKPGITCLPQLGTNEM